MICFVCNRHLKIGDRYRTYLKSGLEIYVHTIGCEGVLLDKISAELDAIKKQCLSATPEEIDQYLRDAGYDVEALTERLRKIVKKAMDESPLNPKNKGLQT